MDDTWGNAFGIAIIIVGLVFVPIILVMETIESSNKPTEFIYIKTNEGIITNIDSWEKIIEGMLFNVIITSHNITIYDIIINESVSLVFRNIKELKKAFIGDYLILYLNQGYDIEDGWYILNIIRNGTLIINVE